MASEAVTYPTYKFFAVSKPEDGVLVISFNKPKRGNSMGKHFWTEFPELLERVKYDHEVNVVVLNGNGRNFSYGIDLAFLASNGTPQAVTDFARKAYRTRQTVAQFQKVSDGLAQLPQPVICCLHGYCIGGAVDVLTATDIRWCTEDAKFSIKEVDVGIVADVGTHGRISKIIGNESMMRELALTGRFFSAQEATQMGLVSRVLLDREVMMSEAMKLAKEIASKSPIATRGIKEMCNYALDHSVAESQNYVQVWNSAMLLSKDVPQAAMAFVQKKTPVFAKL